MRSNQKQEKQHGNAAGHTHQRHSDQCAVAYENQNPVLARGIRQFAGHQPQGIAQEFAHTVQHPHRRGIHRQQAEILAVGAAGALINHIAEAAHQAEHDHRQDHGIAFAGGRRSSLVQGVSSPSVSRRGITWGKPLRLSRLERR